MRTGPFLETAGGVWDMYQPAGIDVSKAYSLCLLKTGQSEDALLTCPLSFIGNDFRFYRGLGVEVLDQLQHPLRDFSNLAWRQEREVEELHEQ
jgi:hypothetical protein